MTFRPQLEQREPKAGTRGSQAQASLEWGFGRRVGCRTKEACTGGQAEGGMARKAARRGGVGWGRLGYKEAVASR